MHRKLFDEVGRSLYSIVLIMNVKGVEEIIRQRKIKINLGSAELFSFLIIDRELFLVQYIGKTLTGSLSRYHFRS